MLPTREFIILFPIWEHIGTMSVRERLPREREREFTVVRLAKHGANLEGRACPCFDSPCSLDR